MPGHAFVRNVGLGHPDPQVTPVFDIQSVQRRVDLGSALKRLGKVDRFAVGKLRSVPRADIHHIVRSRRNVSAVRRMSDPRRGGAVQDGVSPSVDMERESSVVDVGSVRLDPPVVVFVHVEFVEPEHNLGCRGVGLGEVDTTECRSLWLIPRMVVHGRERPALKVAVVGCDVHPCASRRVEGGVPPGVEMDLHRGGLDVVREALDANIGVTVNVEPSKTQGELQVACRKGFVLGVELLGIVPEADLLGVEVGLRVCLAGLGSE